MGKMVVASNGRMANGGCEIVDGHGKFVVVFCVDLLDYLGCVVAIWSG